jgi:hypothetical protein
MTKQKITSVNDQGTFEQVLGKASPEIQNIAKELRSLVAEIHPGVTEVSWGRQRIAGYGVGPKKMSEQFCYIAPLKNHVNFGFFYGADLDDPNGLLEGTGKNLRHIKIKSEFEVKNPALKKLLKQASGHLPRLK